MDSTVLLTGNAIKFTDRGEVVVRATLERQTAHDAVVRFTVQDTGIGISEAGCRLLFQPFSQADSSMTRKYGGTGLGLAISKQLVEIMGGAIGLESTPGVGSTFFFTACFAKPPHAAVGEAKPSAADLRGRRALVVDDNATNRRIVSLQLKSWGMDSEEAIDGNTALALLHQEYRQGRTFDLALLDMQMPGMDGLELARLIKADLVLAGIPLIMLTSIAGHEREARLQAAGVAMCLSKPIKQSKLCDAMVTLLLGHPLRLSKVPKSSAGASNEFQQLAKSARISRPAAHILVAEDNPINQKVILRQLANLGYRADAVANGLEALAAIKRIPYDIVLMDCQMPEMDGYTTARELRQREQGEHRVHIIALTAHTLHGDREKCLSAGMDDYLGKPVKVEELASKIDSFLAQRPRQPLAQSPPALTEGPVDLAALRQAADNDSAFLSELVELYLSQADELLSTLRRALDQNAVSEVESIAHALASSSLTSGMRAMVPPLRQLEAMARQGPLKNPEALIEEIANQLERTRSFLKTHAPALLESGAQPEG